jgi:hypothetical protein
MPATQHRSSFDSISYGNGMTTKNVMIDFSEGARDPFAVRT